MINTLDGFNTQPRITVPFTGDIDPATVKSDTVYLVNLGNTLSGMGFGQRVGINQVFWDAGSKTLVFESDALLQQHSRYALVVTNGVRDATGDPIEVGQFARFRRGPNADEARDEARDDELMEYRKSLSDGENSIPHGRQRMMAVSVFTTQSISGDLEKIHEQIRRSRPAPANFMIANGGTARAVFPVAGIAGIQWARQTGTAPAFTTSFVPTPALQVVPGAVGAVAFGKFTSPDYQNASKVIPATGTLTGHPVAQGSNRLVFELFLPSGQRPASGWPVAIFGHGFTDSMYGAPWTVASVFASRGIATMTINVVGHGGGALGTLNVIPVGGGAPVVVPSGGRGIDQDNNGVIDSTEGVNAAAPFTIVSSRDGLRQTVVDLMQLVQQSGNPVSYASFIRRDPLRGNAPKPVIVQFAKGDRTVPNPTTSAILRAGELADRATFFRNDLAYTATGGDIPKNPHTFLTNIGIPAAAPFALMAQSQIAAFFASNGALVIDPDASGTFFEVPVTLPLPEGLNFLP